MNGEVFDKEQVRERISLAELYEKEVGPLRRAGSNREGLCPFHEERTPSFNVRGPDFREARCFGCGWSGDIFDFWGSLRNVEFKDALAQLAGLTGVTPRVAGVDFSQQKPKQKRAAKRKEWERPALPNLATPSPDELQQLADSRGLQVPGLEWAVSAGRLFVCDWPQFRRRGEWVTLEDQEADYCAPASRSWVVTDPARWVAQYRRLDGLPYETTQEGKARKPRKSWSTRGVGWPLGAADMGNSGKVILLEGGADMLAAYHFFWGLGITDVSVCCILGASNEIGAPALKYFDRKRVKIIMDADPPRLNERTGIAKSAGMEAAARWQGQLTKAGAAVGVYSLEGLTTARGEAVKDLNDLALASRSTIASDEVWSLFFDWDF